MTVADLSPIGLIACEPYAFCAVCGQATPRDRDPIEHHVFSRIVVMGQGERVEEMNSTITVPTCADCRRLRNLASDIVRANPGIVRLLGTVATWHVTAALYGLDAIGHRPPDLDIAPARLGSLVHRLAVPGAAAMYVRRFSPVWQVDASTKHAARARWSELHPDIAADLRRAALDWMADGRPVRALPHPQRLRCADCGTATAPGRRVAEAWFGDRCVACESVHASGDGWYDAFWAWLDADRSIRRRMPRTPDLDGVRPWSKSGGGDGQPWGHVGDHDTVRRAVADLLDITV